MKRSLLAGCIVLFSIIVCCNKAVIKGEQEKNDAVQNEETTVQQKPVTTKKPDEFGLEWTLSFNGTSVKLDSISIDDNPAIILPMRSLRDSISGRVDKIDDKFDRGFKDIINIVNGKKKLVLPVDKNGDFSFRASDIMEKGNNDVYFDLVCKRGFWLTNVIVVMFAVPDR